jgi:hypothetical protein
VVASNPLLDKTAKFLRLALQILGLAFGGGVGSIVTDLIAPAAACVKVGQSRHRFFLAISRASNVVI